jgi:membrane protein
MTHFFKQLTHRFFEDRCLTYAASLTFTTLLSLVPLMMFIFYILSFFPTLKVAGQQIEQFVFHNFVASSANTISQQLQIFLNNVSVLSWWNVSALFFFAIMLVFSMVDAVNNVWHATLKRDFAFSFVVYIILLFIAPIVFAILLLITSYLTSLPFLSDVMNVTMIKKPAFFIFPIIVEWLTFSVFHWMMPSCRVVFRYALVAGFITMALFELAKWGFVQYIHYFPTYQMVYGALAIIPIFFVWIYVSWLIVITGALICNIIQVNH